MSKLEDFLTAAEEQEVVDAIRTAEQATSGEIRIHIERSHGSRDIFDRALEVFHNLKMDNTADANAVLIYVAVEDRDFVIYGDRGINEVVSGDFWESTKDAIVAQFKEGNYKQGLIDGILKAGEQLKKYFPRRRTDLNELPDDISKA